MGVFAQWNGNNLVQYYLNLLLDTVGITTTKDQALFNGLIQVFNWVIALFACAMVDRLGRRVLFLWSGIGMLISYIIWTACSATYAENPDNKQAASAVIAFVVIYSFHYDICYTPMLFAYPAEIFPYRTRQKGIAITLGVTVLSVLFNVFINPIALKNIGWKYYLIFCVLLAIMLAISYLFFPETKGHTLERIAEIFDGSEARIADPMLDRVSSAEGAGAAEDKVQDAQIEHVV